MSKLQQGPGSQWYSRGESFGDVVAPDLVSKRDEQRSYQRRQRQEDAQNHLHERTRKRPVISEGGSQVRV